MNVVLPNLPQHIAIIMDGNGRWAKKKGLPRLAGHKAGLEATKKIIRECGEKGIKTLTLFAFGMDNWRRPSNEVDHLMQLFTQALQTQIKELHKHNVKFKLIGDLSRFSASLQKHIQKAEDLTKNNTGLELIVAASYSGRWDILQACQKLAEKVKLNEIVAEEITADLFSLHLSTHGNTFPDLLIRTSGEYRISDFMLWQLAYTEFYFSSVYWPDFNTDELEKAFAFYQKRERRFGYTSEQICELQGEK